MHFPVNSAMFYAANLLSMKSNTELSLVYFVSTTKKKLNKQTLNNLNIQKILKSLLNPPQPFALRLYSYLVVGVVRIYLYKLKAYENEVQNLLNLLSYKRKKVGIKVGKDKKNLNKVNEDYEILLDDSSDHALDNITHQDYIHSGSILDPIHEDLIDIEPPKRFKKNVILDTITEFSNCSKFCSFSSLSGMTQNQNDFNFNLQKYFLIKEIENKKERGKENKKEIEDFTIFEEGFCSYDFDPIEKMRSSSLIEPKIKSSSLLDQTIFKEDDYQGKVFNLINLGSRLTRVVNFYVLLEKCSKGEVEAYQKEAYGEILLS
ncbi:Sister chromatid cohesion 1 protein 3 [Nosema bombycis CQ1]|uniref:Sister chromatid cohesion 1 protein 3 n=1 Tax=Nosema bombycis (strain CQ1 / CVCC 102059) TaxID=578461 RepID=R0KPS8_NOSB1|nr:Sister chromatid cohesion 1 protein 3 [Nosema bombycis CQ1]|eukprot:EOB12716.1 Sister chromatid cohesion 1 protein 3 [Nosema bombycis CQ1]